MQFKLLTSIASLAAAVSACTQCPHPGNFTGDVSTYWQPTPNFCQTTITNGDVYVALPDAFWNPRDESPCDETVIIFSPTATSKIVTATVVGSIPSATGDDILLTTNGMAALAPDANPNHAPEPIVWTFT